MLIFLLVFVPKKKMLGLKEQAKLMEGLNKVQE